MVSSQLGESAAYKSKEFPTNSKDLTISPKRTPISVFHPHHLHQNEHQREDLHSPTPTRRPCTVSNLFPSVVEMPVQYRTNGTYYPLILLARSILLPWTQIGPYDPSTSTPMAAFARVPSFQCPYHTLLTLQPDALAPTRLLTKNLTNNNESNPIYTRPYAPVWDQL